MLNHSKWHKKINSINKKGAQESIKVPPPTKSMRKDADMINFCVLSCIRAELPKGHLEKYKSDFKKVYKKDIEKEIDLKFKTMNSKLK